MFTRQLIVSIALLELICGGCVRVNIPPGAPRSYPTFPPNQGSRYRIQVVRLLIPPEDVKNYPALVQQHVGRGLVEFILEVLSLTEYFEFMESEQVILRRLESLWRLEEEGFYQGGIQAQDPVRAGPGYPTPEFLVYAKIFDFVGCSPLQTVRVTKKTMACETSVRLQVRFTCVKDAKIVAIGSSVPENREGVSIHSVTLPLFAAPNQPFDQGAVGRAIRHATYFAVDKALYRLNRWRRHHHCLTPETRTGQHSSRAAP